MHYRLFLFKLIDLDKIYYYVIFFQRYTEVDVETGLQSSLHSNLLGSLHGTDHSFRIRGVPAEISGNTVQSGKKPSQCVHR